MKHSDHETRPWARRLVLGGAGALAAWPPLAYGSVHEEWWSLAAIGAAILLLAWPLSLRGRGRTERSRWERTALAGGLLLAFLPILQLVPWPSAVLARVDPGAAAALARAEDSLPEGERLATVPSLSPARTRGASCRLATCLVLVLAVATSVRSRRDIVFVAGLVVLVASAEAIYGIRQVVTGTDSIWGHEKVYYRGDATGTYVNRNHLAGLLALALPLAMMLVVARPQNGGAAPESVREAIAHLLGNRAGLVAVLVWGWASLVLVIGLLLSHSRWGILSAGAGAVLVVGFFLARKSRRVYGGILLAILVASLVVASWRVGFGAVEERFRSLSERENASVSHRLLAWRTTASIVADHPFLGTGLGTFRDVFPAYRPATLPNPYHHAHNDYLNLASDLGIPGLLAALALLAGAAGQLAVRTQGADRFGRDAASGILGSLFALAVLSIADFNLQIQANAMTASVVLGLGLAVGRRSHAHHRRDVLGGGRFAALFAACAAAAVVLGLEAFSMREAALRRPYVESSVARLDVREFEASLGALGEEDRHHSLEEARGSFAGSLEMADDGWSWGEAAALAERTGDRRAAIDAAVRALRAQPTVPIHHLRLGALLADEGRIDLADRAFANAREFGRSEVEVLRAVGRWELRRSVEEGSAERLRQGLADWRRAASVDPPRDLEAVLREAGSILADPELRLEIVPSSGIGLERAYGLFRRDGELTLALSVGLRMPDPGSDRLLELAELSLSTGDPAGALEMWGRALESAGERDRCLRAIRASADRHGAVDLLDRLAEQESLGEAERAAFR